MKMKTNEKKIPFQDSVSYCLSLLALSVYIPSLKQPFLPSLTPPIYGAVTEVTCQEVENVLQFWPHTQHMYYKYFISFRNKKHEFRIHSIESQNPSAATGTSLEFLTSDWNTRFTYDAVCSQMRLFQR